MQRCQARAKARRWGPAAATRPPVFTYRNDVAAATQRERGGRGREGKGVGGGEVLMVGPADFP